MNPWVRSYLAGLVLTFLTLSDPTSVALVAHAAGPWYVATTGDDTINDCLSASAACASINGALAKPGFADGDTIKVAIGTYYGTGSEVVLLNKSVTLSGGWDAAFATQTGLSTIDGQGVRRGMKFFASTAWVDRFVIQHGFDSSDGGAGIKIIGGTVSIENSTIMSNTSSYLTGSGFGGGIYNWGDLTIASSTISNNVADSAGGGIFSLGFASISDSTISGNTAGRSGDRGAGGGGIYGYGLSINNSTVVNNKVLDIGEGGGILSDGSYLTIKNSIVARNSAPFGPDCYGSIASDGYNIIGNAATCTFAATTGDQTYVDPLLGSLQDNGGLSFTHALLFGSPAINSGKPSGCTTGQGNPLSIDQRGFSRVDRCDIGAFEYQGVIHQSFLPALTNYGGLQGISGRVRYNGFPASSVLLELRFYDGSTWSTIATTSTAADGSYMFSNEPSLNQGQTYYVRYSNPSQTDSSRLCCWFTRDLTSYIAGANSEVGDFDIANVFLQSPLPGATVSLPNQFQWNARSATPSDSYEWDVYAPNDNNLYYFTGWLGYVNSYTLGRLPSGFSTNRYDPWYVIVWSPDFGYGISFYYRYVAFSNFGYLFKNLVPMKPRSRPQFPDRRPLPKPEYTW